MKPEEFFAMVKQMRFAQMKYFRTKNKEDLLAAKSLEKMVDGCPPFFVFEGCKIHLKRRENIAQGAKK